MVRRLVALALIAACDHSSAVTPDSAPGGTDAAGRTITGRDVVRNIVNDSNHVPMLVEDVPLSALVVSQELADHTLQDVPVAADGTFSFTTVEPQYRLQVGVDGASPVEYQLDAPQLLLASRQLGRYQRDPVPAGTSLAVTVTSAPGGGTAVISSTGLWTQSFRSGGSNGSFTVDWTAAGSLGGPRGMLDATKNDRLYYVVFDNIGSPQYAAITSTCTTDITMTGGVNNVACTAAPLPASSCLHAQVRFAAETTRIGAAVGSSYPYFFANWIIEAPAIASTGPGGALWLAFLFPGGLTTAPADYDHNLMFGNPYPGHSVALLMSTGKYRSYAIGTAMPVSIAASTTTHVAAQADCSTPTETPAGAIALGTNVQLDGVRLDSDSVSIGLADHDHTVTWDATGGPVDYWVVRPIEVSVNANQTVTTPIRAYVSIDRRVVFDPGTLEAGKRYYFDIAAVRALPDAVTGNFHDFGFPAQPFASSNVPSGVFRVLD